MYCSNCGTKITDEETRFCPKCGIPVSSKPNEYSSKSLLILMVTVAIFFIGYIYLSKNNNKVHTPEVAIKLNKKSIIPNNLTKNDNYSSNFELSSSTPSTNSKPISAEKQSSKTIISKSLSSFRHSLDISNSKSLNGKVIKVKLFQDNHSEQEALNVFASFYASCYGNIECNTAYASISLLKNGKTTVMSMGIGRLPASQISTGTWKRFENMGSQLKSWVKTRENKNPGSKEGACFFSSN